MTHSLHPVVWTLSATWALSCSIAASNVAHAESDAPRLDLRPGRPAASPAAGVRALESGAWLLEGELRGAEADTARLAVILVEFPADDDPNTTGDGRFEREFDDAFSTNRPPHDHAYFDLQCESVENYFRAATSGRLDLEWTVFPAAPSFFEMPNRMRYYNPDTTDAALDIRLAEFFRDAVTVADQGGVPFSDYDYTVVFHAGVGQDLLIAEDTPSDIPSAFISLEELRESLGENPDWAGIPVEGGSHAVPNGLWLPETENQEGIEFGITGVFAQLLGSQFGLPILFNPDSGAPGIGRFGLMDQGGGNLFGDVPALPSAWERFDRGWADARVVTSAADVGVLARGTIGRGGDAELVVVPVDEREYFLIENRKKELDANGELQFVTADPSGANVRVGVVADEYDYGIPGSGLLIWHIDQQVIDENREANRVNADFMHRGVKLLEADGLDDIGLRPEGGFGLPEDCYFEGNNTELTPTSTPSSRSNYSNADTHVFVTSISDSGAVMTCDVDNDIVLDGWPSTIGTAYQALPPAVGEIVQEGEELVIVFDDEFVSLFDEFAQRTFEFDLPPNDPVVDYVVADVDGACAFCTEIVAITEAGGVLVLSPKPVPRGRAEDLARDGPVGVGAARAITYGDVDGAAPLDLVIAGDDQIVVGAETASARTYSFDATGTPIGVAATRDAFGSVACVVVTDEGEVRGFTTTAIDQEGSDADIVAMLDGAPLYPPVFGDLDRDGAAEMIVVCEDGLHAYALDGGALVAAAGWPVLRDDPFGAPALGDVDDDGRLDVIAGGANQLHVFAGNGVRADGWPVTLSAFADAGAVVGEPVIADVDDDGDQDVILASPDGLLRAFDGDGSALTGWPVPTGRAHATAPAVSAIGGGAIVVADAGSSFLHAFGAPGAADGAHWPGARGGSGRAGVFDTALLGEPIGGGFFPESSVYVYPNPAHESARFRYFLGSEADVEVAIYDVSGLEITRLEASGQAGLTNEIEWDLRNADREPVAPGLYVARITARGTGRTETLETKLAVYR